MSGRLSKYSDYKDSGVDWIGRIPSEWDCRQLKYAATLSIQKATLEAAGTYVGMENISSGDGKYIATSDMSPEGQSLKFQGGDVLFGKLRPYLAKSWLATFSGICSSEFLVLRTAQLEPRYLNYMLLSRDFIAVVDSSTYGTKMPRASWDFIGMLKIPVPERALSEKIAKFLDYETAKIDALIAKQQQLIALLQEKRQAVISHAVTKGLNPAAPLRDSGVEWLGKVPAHWTVTKVRNRYEVQLGKMLKQSRITGENLYPYLSVFDVQWGQINVSDLSQMDFDIREQEKYRLQPRDLIVNEGGSYVGRSAIWQGELENCFYQKALHRMRPLSKEDTTQFLYYVMMFATKKGVFVAGGNQTTIDHLTATQLNNYKFPFPPIAEQFQIASHLDDINLKFERLISKAKTAVELLQERRTALISAAVTGKIDVRGWQPPLANPAGATP